jgi:tetratricopeptide (TPR) repeat protein
LKPPAQPNPAFVTNIANNLAYWQAMLAELPEAQVGILDGEKNNLVQAIRFGLRVPETRLVATQVAVDAFHFVDRVGYQREWIRVLQAIYDRQFATDPVLAVAVLNRLGQLYRVTRQLDQALLYHEEARLEAKQHRNELDYGIACWQLGADYLQLGQLEQAEPLLIEACSILEKVDESQFWLPAAMNELGTAYEYRGNYVQAEHIWRESYLIYNAIEKVIDATRVAQNLFSLLAQMERYEECNSLIEIVGEKLSDERLLVERAKFLVRVGAVYAKQNEWPESERVFRQTNVDDLIQAGLLDWAAANVVNLGYVLGQQEKLEEATRFLEDGLRIAREGADDVRIVSAAINLADVLVARGDFNRAIAYYGLAETCAAGHSDSKWFSETTEEAVMKRARAVEMSNV